MKNLNIENAKKLFFIDKQHYLNFRKAWAEAVNSPKAKPHTEPCSEWISQTQKSTENTGTQKMSGWITSRHNLLFCILTEKSVLKAFTPVTNKNKILNGMNPFLGLSSAYDSLRRHLANANDYINFLTNAANNIPLDKWSKRKGMTDNEVWLDRANDRKKYLDGFLAPFNGTVTINMLVELSKNISESVSFPSPEKELFNYTKREQIKYTALTAPITHKMLWDMYTEG